MRNIHPQAVVEDGAKIGEDVTIEAYAYVSKDAVLGDGVLVKQGARIVGDTHIGEGGKIYSYAIVGDIPQDVSYRAEENTGVRIGKNAFIMAYCHVAHDCVIGNSVILANNATLAGHVELGDYSVVGGMTPIHQFVRVGESCMIAGASALSQDVVPFCLAEGNRAYIRSLNLVGIRRRFDKDTVEEINKAYKFLFRKSGDLKAAASELLAGAQIEQVRKMCEFILSTKRGIPLAKGRE